MFRRAIKYIFPVEIPKPLGRWKTENCNNQLNRKIDLSNEDHCGPCGDYVLKEPKKIDPININGVCQRK